MTDELRAEKFLELFNKSRDFTEELLRDNEKLRGRLGALQEENKDYATRYTAFRAGRGMSKFGIDELPDLVDEQMASFDPQVNATWLRFSAQPALQQLHHIWQWPPDASVEYAYPSQRWFKEHSQARIKDTRDLYRGD